MTVTRNVPFSPPDISETEIQGVVEALKSGWITTGPRTKEFERRIAEFCGTNKAVCLNSATACEESILRLLGIGEGDEVITSAYTVHASVSSRTVQRCTGKDKTWSLGIRHSFSGL